MARNNLNYLKRSKQIQEITQRAIEIYGEDIKYSAIWRNIINPVYYMSYASYIKVINEPNLKNRIAEKEKAINPANRRERQPQKNFF